MSDGREGMIGARIPRVEDERFLRGEGRFVADLKLPFMLEACILRSPQAHARIAAIDTGAALSCEGVVAVVTAADLPPGLPPIPCRIPTHGDLQPFLQPVLAAGLVRYVGEPVAVIVAESRALAEDAAERVAIAWEALPPIADTEAAQRPGAAAIHPAGNVAARWRFDIGQVDAALAASAVVERDRFTIQRHTAMPLETRGLLARYDAARDLLEVLGPTKVPHTNRSILAGMLGMPEGSLRLAEPDVGGSFGARGEFYPEDFLIPWLALRLRRPVRWIEDRLEHFAAINHSRQATFTVTAGADADGLLTAMDVTLVADMGSYIRTHGAVVPSHASASFPGPYRLRNYRVEAAAVLTSKTPTGTLRAPGMFEANFARERMLDRLAARLGLDPAELRRRNLIPPEAMPWHVGTESVRRPTIFDGGNFPLVYARALEAAGWHRPLPPGTATLRRGRGIAALVEPSALGPFEGARVEVDAQGFVQVISGSSNQGQGQETSLAQIAAAVLTVPIERIRVRHGDTGLIQYGGGTYASRTAVMAGNAVYAAARTVREKAIRAAAQKLEAAEPDLVLADGRVHLAGAPEHGLALAALARMVSPGNPELVPPPKDAVAPDHDGLAATSYLRAVPSGTSVFAVHVAEVAVDVETGQVAVERYLVACDVGRAINPMIVEGQIVGGVVQGLGGTLLEELVYGADGQLQTGSFADYLLPSVHEAPRIEVLVLEETPAASNALGVKGVGEVGPSGVAAAVGNAVAAALGLAAGIVDLPITPERVLAALAMRRAA
jgi:carbon-monoxide dehydrogenase large subunit/6-hydroxypseudooxynicotine dehydrogenase subunit gamma